MLTDVGNEVKFIVVFFLFPVGLSVVYVIVVRIIACCHDLCFRICKPVSCEPRRNANADVDISTTNPSTAYIPETRQCPAASTRSSSLRTVRPSERFRPGRTLIVPPVYPRNRTSYTPQLQQPNGLSRNRNSQPALQQLRSPTREQSSTGNESNVRSPNPTHTSRFSLDDLNSYSVPTTFKEQACPICLEPLQEERVSNGNCLHLAHTSCLKQWLAKDALFACPVCRVPLEDGF